MIEFVEGLLRDNEAKIDEEFKDFSAEMVREINQFEIWDILENLLIEKEIEDGAPLECAALEELETAWQEYEVVDNKFKRVIMLVKEFILNLGRQ